MPQSSEEKRDRFSRMYPSRVDTLVKTLRLIENCTNRSNYEWDQDLVKRSWIEIGQCFTEVAGAYKIKFNLEVDGKPLVEYDTTKPLEEPNEESD